MEQERAIYSLFELISKDGQITRLTNGAPLNPAQPEILIDGKRWISTPVRIRNAEKTVDQTVGIKLDVAVPPMLRNNTEPLVTQGMGIRRLLVNEEALDHANYFMADMEPPESEPNFRILRVDNYTVNRVFSQSLTQIEADLDDLRSTWNVVFRPQVPNRCYHRYRSPECSYTGDRYWDLNNKPVSTLAEDNCNLTIKACELRFPTGNLPFGGVPPQILEQEVTQ